MRSTQDALYNWLTIKVVAQARKQDVAAQETYELFTSILADHHISHVQVERLEDMYLLTYEVEGTKKSARFPRESIDCYLEQMNREPEKFRNYE